MTQTKRTANSAADHDEASANPVDVHVGSRMRLCRAMRTMSQGQLAEKLGMSFQQVQKYEAGVNRVGASRMHQISLALNVPVGFFFDAMSDNLISSHGRQPGPDPEFTNGFADAAPNRREAQAILRAYSRIGDPAMRQAVFQFVRSLADPD